MQNGILKLDWASLAEAVVTAAIFAVLAALVTLVTTSGFNLFTTNWVLVGENFTNIGFIAGVVSLGKSLLTTNSGSVLGITPSN